MASKRVERAKAKVELATGLAAIGGAAGSAIAPGVGTGIGLAAGGLAGLIIGDRTTVFPMDMIAIPAFQAYLLTQQPSFSVYIKEGEVLTQVIETDAQEAVALVTESEVKVKRTRAKGAGLPKKYAKMGFKKGWAAYNKTPKRKAAKKRATKKRGKR
jgi:hypothetical protein